MRGHERDLGDTQIPKRVFCKLSSEQLAELRAQATRLERSLSWIAQLAWRIAKSRIKNLEKKT